MHTNKNWKKEFKLLFNNDDATVTFENCSNRWLISRDVVWTFEFWNHICQYVVNLSISTLILKYLYWVNIFLVHYKQLCWNYQDYFSLQQGQLCCRELDVMCEDAICENVIFCTKNWLHVLVLSWTTTVFFVFHRNLIF